MQRLSKIISIFLITITLSLFSKCIFDAVLKQRINTSTQEYMNNTSIAAYVNLDKEEEQDSGEKTYNYSYQAVIQIPKLNIEQGFLDENSNNVDKNIALIYPSDLKEVGKSSLVIAAHSGNSSKSYFHNLNQLETHDEIIIYQNGKKFVFKVIKSFQIDKDGKLNIEQKGSKLYLTTCSEENKDKQLVVVASLDYTDIY